MSFHMIGRIIFQMLLIGIMPIGVHAETIAAQALASSLGLIPLQKMTVGPDDQYHGTVDPTGRQLVFTRKSDLVPHLCSQSILTGDVSDFLPLTADSQEPSFSPDGTLAFTYYKFHASGDICIKPLKGELQCLKMENGEPASPFWKSQKEVGYLFKESWVKESRRKESWTQNSKIVISNLETGSQEVLAEGNLWSPSMQPGGRYLFYNSTQKKDSKRVLVMKDLQTGKTKVIHFSLPGISGFPAVSSDEKYLYFSHYLNDTNNDNVIDANDNSVIFRVPLQELLGRDEIFPEQLTSVDSNCSFPRPVGNVIYATCAFDGSLDIYRLPTGGIVPTSWNEATLNNAHQTARSYSERILLLNTLKYRFPEKRDLEERILSNHLMADDLASSEYYLQRVQAAARPKDRSFYALLNLYLEARKKKKIQRSDEVTASLENDLAAISVRMDRVSGNLRFKKILKGLLQTFLNQRSKSAAALSEIRFNSPSQPLTHPLERFLYFELANWTFPGQSNRNDWSRPIMK